MKRAFSSNQTSLILNIFPGAQPPDPQLTLALLPSPSTFWMALRSLSLSFALRVIVLMHGHRPCSFAQLQWFTLTQRLAKTDSQKLPMAKRFLTQMRNASASAYSAANGY